MGGRSPRQRRTGRSPSGGSCKKKRSCSTGPPTGSTPPRHLLEPGDARPLPDQKRRAPSVRRPLRSPGPHPWCSWSGRLGRARPRRCDPPSSSCRRRGRVVFGVAPSAIAANPCCRCGDGGTVADTIDKLLAEHRTGHPKSGVRSARRGDGDRRRGRDARNRESSPNSSVSPSTSSGGWRWSVTRSSSPRSAGVGCSGCSSTPTAASNSIVSTASPTTWERAASLQLRRGDPSRRGPLRA
jgi:hypothetical protein